MKKFMLATVAFSALALGSAQAVPFNGTYGITVYQTENGGGTAGSPAVQASPSNPLFTASPSAQIASFQYSGPLDFSNPQPNATDTFGTFFNPAGIQGGGSFTGGQATFLATVLSSPTFARTSLVNITGSYSGTLTGNVIHDDGISLFSGPGNTPVANSQAPTTVISTPYTLPGSDNQFRLIYVATNGAPSVLTLDVTNSTPVPEPMSMALLGVGLIGAGLVRRRKA